MMNITSALWKAEHSSGIGYRVTRKSDNTVHSFTGPNQVSIVASHFAAINENQFNRECESLARTGEWEQRNG